MTDADIVDTVFLPVSICVGLWVIGMHVLPYSRMKEPVPYHGSFNSLANVEGHERTKRLLELCTRACSGVLGCH